MHPAPPADSIDQAGQAGQAGQVCQADQDDQDDPDRVLGARVVPGGVRFAVWAPKARSVDVVVEGEGPGEPTLHRIAPVPGGDGLHTGVVAGLGAGARYQYRLDGGDAFPDPWSRFQPNGVHGPSEVIDPTTFAWTDADRPGLRPDGLVIYELHVGTFTPRGTFTAAAGQMAALRRLGVTAIELMPVADFPGRRNWGYDGVALFAPSRAYGRPDALRRLVDTAHRHGLGVILDVVYNHLGPDGNYLRAFSDDYFTDRHHTPWGEAINYDGPNSRRVRDFVIGNALMWLEEYHVDGFRLDATHAILDDSPQHLRVHLLAELAERIRAASPRPIVLVAEDERNDVRLVRPVAVGGYGLDAVWADDFHHELRVKLTGERDAWLADYAGTTASLAGAIDDGFVFQGQVAPHTGEPRGSRVTDEPARAFVFCIENHDQVGNRALGERLSHLVDPAAYAVASALLLFAPETPLIFMGQEYAASAPFLYFTDHEPDLGRLVTAGRRREFAAFAAFADEAAALRIPDPQADTTFLRSKLDPKERREAGHAGIFRLYRTLLALRRNDPVLRIQDRTRTRAAAIGADIVAVHRWFGDEHRLLLANFGAATEVTLGAGTAGTDELPDLPAMGWRTLLSTTRTRFGGTGERVPTPEPREGTRLRLPARAAVILTHEANGLAPASTSAATSAPASASVSASR